MGRKFISQKKQTKNELFDTLVKNAIDFLDSSLDDLSKRPKNSIVDFFTSIELFLKARLMNEHWTLIISKPETANRQAFSVGDFHSVTLEDAIKRLKFILNEPLNERTIKNFKALGEHRNQIVHFGHTDYVDLNATKASVVVEQWSSWHFLHALITGQWKVIFYPYLPDIERIHERIMSQSDFIKARFTELKSEIDKKEKSGKIIIDCHHCQMHSGIVLAHHKWGQEYNCAVCGTKDTAIATIEDHLNCPVCGSEFKFFDKSLKNCPTCETSIDTDILIDLCEDKYKEGDAWCKEDKIYTAGCHVCQNERPSVFYIDNLWSCVSCFDRGWQAMECPHCDEFVTGDTECIKYYACYKCEGIRSDLIELLDA